jgi:hypothetical protein
MTLRKGLLLAVAADLRGGGADGGVVGFQALERVLLERAGEEGAFQRVQLAGDVVVLVEVAVVEDVGKDFLGQDVLDQHLAHVGLAQRGVDGLLRVGEKPGLRRAEVGIAGLLLVDHGAQGLQHGGQVGLELLHRGAEIGDLLALEAEEQLEQLLQLGGVGHVAAQHLFLVLDEHGGAVVAEDDVVLRIALLELLGDLFVQVVGGVLGLPVAQRHAQLVQERAIDGDVGLGGGLERVFGQEDQIVLAAPGLEQVLERLAHDGLALAAAGPLDEVELLEVVVDQDLAHGRARAVISGALLSQIGLIPASIGHDALWI